MFQVLRSNGETIMLVIRDVVAELQTRKVERSKNNVLTHICEISAEPIIL